MEFPQVLYVSEEPVYDQYVTRDIKHLVGSGWLDSRVPDNSEETVVATYQLVAVDKYKKLTTKTSTVTKA